MQEDDDIPLLTEVHTLATQPSKTLSVTPELMAEIIEQLKPQLRDLVERDVEQSVTQKLKKKMHGYLVSESTEIQKTSQAFLDDSLKQQFEQQSEALQKKAEEIHQQAEVKFKDYINAEITTVHEADYVALMETIRSRIDFAHKAAVEQIKEYVAQEVATATATAQQTIMENNQIFADKTRADFATEIPKMMHANAEIISTDLATSLDKMRTQGVADVQARLTQAMPVLEQVISHQLQASLMNLEGEMIERSTQALQTNAAVVRADLERSLSKMQSQGLMDAQDAIIEALPSVQKSILEQVKVRLESLEASTIARATIVTTSMRSDLEAALAEMQAKGVSEVQAKMLEALPQLQDSLTEKLQVVLQSVEVDTVEKATQLLQDRIIKLHNDLLTEHQAGLTRESTTAYQTITSQLQSELKVHTEELQLNSKQQLTSEINQTLPALYEAISNEIKDKVRQDLTQNIKTEVESLLASVRLTFNQ